MRRKITYNHRGLNHFSRIVSVNSIPMNTESRGWVNPYIDRIDSKPGFLLPFERKMKPDAIDPQLTAQARAVIDARRAEFKRCYVEVGSGSGRHLIERAAADRESLYVGFELRYKRAFRTAEKVIGDATPTA